MIRYRGYCHSWNGAAWWGTRKTQPGTVGCFDMTVRCVLTWSDMSSWPFWCDWGMCSHLIRYKGYFHSVMVRGLVPSMSDVSAGHSDLGSDIRATAILWMKAPGQLPGILSMGLISILMWLWDWFPHDQMQVQSLSTYDMWVLAFPQIIVCVSYHAGGCECCAFS